MSFACAKARRALAQLAAGDTVEILADDPASPLDMNHFVKQKAISLPVLISRTSILFII